MHHQARRLQARPHVGERELHGLMPADGLAECRALLSVANCALESRLSNADGAGCDVDSTDLERAHHLLEALTLLAADQITRRHFQRVEQDLAGVEPLVAELLE